MAAAGLQPSTYDHYFDYVNIMHKYIEKYLGLTNAILDEVHVDAEAFQILLLDGPMEKVNLVLPPPMQLHPKTEIISPGTADLIDLIDELMARGSEYLDNPLVKPNYERFMSLWSAACTLKQLHRFTHHKQPRLFERPAGDGSNLKLTNSINPDGSMPLSVEWSFHRAWIRFLHFPALLQDTNRNLNDSIPKLYENARLLLEEEMASYPAEGLDDYPQDDTHPSYDMVNWMVESRDHIYDALSAAASLAFQPPRASTQAAMRGAPAQPALSRRGTLDLNLSAEHINRMLTAVIQRYEELIAETHPFERMIIELLRLENAFELALTAEHVEDKLFTKQILAFNEEVGLTTGIYLDAGGVDKYTVEDNWFFPYGPGRLFEDFALEICKSFSLVNRQRRNFRLLRDWIGGRPWQKIYQLYDTSTPSTQWLKKEIGRFQDIGLRENPKPEANRPSDLENVASQLFGFGPVDLSTMQAQAQFQSCGLCSVAYSGGATHDHSVAVLRCHPFHNFHLACIIAYWDHPNKYLHSCPTCGNSPTLNHERIGLSDDPAQNAKNNGIFDPNKEEFVYNLWNYNPPDSYLKPVGSQERQDASRKVFYDLPNKPNQIHGGAPPGLTAELLAPRYWVRENVASLEAVYNGITHTLDSSQPRLNIHEMRTWDQRVRRMTTEMQFRRTERSIEGRLWPVMIQFPDHGGELTLRYTVDRETAWLRKQRRIRNRSARERNKREKKGLFDTFLNYNPMLT